MQKMGLTAAERRAFHNVLRSAHTRRIRITVTDLDGDVQADLSDRLLDGQVIVDADAEVTRTATLSLLDPKHSLNFDTDSPDDGALFADRMIRIYYSVLVPSLGRHVSVVVFTGPITKLDRKGDVVDVEAQGKESLARGAIWRPLTLKRGTLKTDAIRTILKDRAGERRFALPDLKASLPKARSFDRWAEAWASAKSIARSMDRQLFYPGTGVATLRLIPRRPVWTFRTGTGGDVVSDVAISYLLADVKNTIVVRGGIPKGKKERVRFVAIANPKHPLSPQRLGRNGIERHLVEVIEDDSIRSEKEAETKARRILEDRLRAVVEATFDSLPIPHLDELDLVRVETGDTAVEFRLRRFSIPLGSGDPGPPMPVGYHKKTTVNRRRIRR